VRKLQVILFHIAVACLAAGRASAQSMATAQVGLARQVAAPAAVRTRSLAVVQSASREPRRRPYVVSGAVVGGVAGGVLLAHGVAKTDDAMVFPVVYASGVVAGGAALGAFGGLIVSVIVHRGAR